MTLRERLKAVTNNFAWEQDWNIQEYAVHKRDIEYRRGKADAYGDVVYRLDEVLEEFPEGPVVKDKMTLTELARELRKIFKFRYLTVSRNTNLLLIWKKKPAFRGRREWQLDGPVDQFLIIEPDFLSINLDLSEYKDADGNIDYSKCIVEVEE